MIPDDSILLKIHRQFKQDEAVQILEKELAAARFEIGVLKSELAELKSPEGKRTAKQWKQDEFFKEMNTMLKNLEKKKRDLQFEMEKWRNRFFALVATMTNEPNVQESDTTGDAMKNDSL